MAAAGAFVFVATLLVFGRAIAFDFLYWDDDLNVTNNPHIRHLTLENLRWMFSDFSYSLRYQPLSWLAWTLDAELFGIDPAAFHAMNVLLHAVCGVLLLFALDRLAREILGMNASRATLIVVVVATLLWTLHPMRVEVVAWVTGRKYIDVALLLLMAFLVDPGLPTAHESWSARFRRRIAVVIFGASLMTYPIGLDWPLIVVIVDYARFRRESDAAFPWRTCLTTRSPLFILSSLFVVLNLSGRFLDPGAWSTAAPLEAFSPVMRVMQASFALVFSAFHMVLPTSLSPVYAHLWDRAPADPLLLATFVVVVVASGCLVWLSRRRDIHWPLLCGLAYGSLMITKLGWTETPFSPSDRYAHLASLVLPVVFLCLVRPRLAPLVASGDTGPFRSTLLASSAVVVVLSLVSILQLEVWRNTETLLAEIVASTSPHRYSSLYFARLGDFRAMNEDHLGAIEAYTHAIDVAPHNQVARSSRAVLSARLGHIDDAVADAKALLAVLENADDRFAIATILLGVGRDDEALLALRASVGAHPQHLASYQAIERILLAQGDVDGARLTRDRIDALAADRARPLGTPRSQPSDEKP
jgi:hypothetical protein